MNSHSDKGLCVCVWFQKVMQLFIVVEKDGGLGPWVAPSVERLRSATVVIPGS